MQLRTTLLAALVTAAACGPGPDRESRPQSPRGALEPTRQELDAAAADFDQLRTGYLEWYFEAHPVRATELGVHDHDSRLPAMDRAGIQRRIENLLELLADLEQIRFDLMRDEDRYDYAVLEYGIRAELLDLEEVRDWANDPGVYTELIGRGLSSIVDRDYAPFEERAASLGARLTAAHRVLDAAPDNRSPPRVWTELALIDARGLLDYLVDGLPAKLREQAAGAVPTGVDSVRTQLAAALESHIRWLETELLPRSTGTFRLGRFMLQRRLLYNDHISLSLEEMERLNRAAIEEYRQRLAAVADSLGPDRTPRAILDSISGVGPAPEQLLDRARASLAAARDWALESGVVEVRRQEPPTVRASPPYARIGFSSLDTPGAFESGTLAAYLNLTTVGEEWDEELDAGLTLTALHQGFPGQYVQRQYEREQTELRRVLPTRAFTAGWAHYAEQMALDEGVSDDPAVRLEQIRRALQRHARWDAVIRLHAHEQPLDEVVTSFMEIAHLDEFPARREVLRATRDPGVLADALGRMQLVELRDDYREALAGERREFSLSEFHGRLLRLGLPFALAREVLVP